MNKKNSKKEKKIRRNDKKDWIVEKADTTRRGLKARIIHTYLADGSANISAADLKEIEERFTKQGYKEFHIRAMANKWRTFKGWTSDLNIDEDYWKKGVDDASKFSEFRRVEIVLLNKDQ